MEIGSRNNFWLKMMRLQINSGLTLYPVLFSGVISASTMNIGHKIADPFLISISETLRQGCGR
jgi:hypothetical protein